MRISDWSSDVCSSDLGNSQIGFSGAGRTEAEDQLVAAERRQIVFLDQRTRNDQPLGGADGALWNRAVAGGAGSITVTRLGDHRSAHLASLCILGARHEIGRAKV